MCIHYDSFINPVGIAKYYIRRLSSNARQGREFSHGTWHLTLMFRLNSSGKPNDILGLIPEETSRSDDVLHIVLGA